MILGIGATHTDELIPRDAELSGITTHILSEETLVEVVVTSGHRSVNSIKRRSAHELHSLVECQSALDIVAQTLQVAESCVTLVAVIYILLDTELLEQQHTTDTEQDFLLQTVLPVTTIE